MKTTYKSQFRTVQTILRGLLYNRDVLNAIRPHWENPGLFESPEANNIGSAAIKFYNDFGEPMADESAWLDTLSGQPKVSENELTNTERLWQQTLKTKERKTKSIIAKAEEYFEQVRIRNITEKIETLSSRGHHIQARDLIMGFEPLTLKGHGRLQRADEEHMVLIKYLFKPFLAYGYITLLEGHSGTGKTTVLCDLIARITNGWKMPPADPDDGKRRKPKNVLYITSEDGWRDLTLPRLKAAKADFDRVFCWPLDDPKPCFPRDIHVLEQKIITNDIKLVIFDPIISFMEDQWADANSAADVRRIMDALNRLAEKLNVAFLAVRHFNKHKSSNGAMHQGSGSGAWTQTCRFQFFTSKHPEQKDEYVLVPSKVNTVKSMERFTLRYRIDSIQLSIQGQTGSYGMITWKPLGKDEKSRSADDWLNGKIDTKIKKKRKNRPGRITI